MAVMNGQPKPPSYPEWAKAYARRRYARATIGGLLCVLLGLTVGLLLGGCATSTPLPTSARDGEAQAVAIAWRVYGRTDLPPLVRWKQGDQLSCTDPNSGKPGFPVWLLESGQPEAGCREGYTMTPYSCDVAWHGELSFSETALAHELLHVAQARAGIFDSKHQRDDWRLVDVANEAIRAAGR